MRIILFLLLFAGSDAAENIVQRIDKAMSEIPTTLNKADLLATYEMTHAHEGGVERELQLNPQQQEALQNLEAQALSLHRDEPHRSEGIAGSIDAINRHTPLGEFLYQGDIVLDIEQARTIAAQEAKEEISRDKRQAMNFKVGSKKYRWPNATVTYAIQFGIDKDTREVFHKAANQWQSHTCVNFVEDRSAKQRVELVEESGCFSNMGYLGKIQKLSLGYGCDKIGIAAHEIGHIMGMWHTQSRHDRDQYILVDMKNIRRRYWSQFDKQTEETNENFGIPYDYGTVMHYSARYFSMDEYNKTMYTMVPKDIRYLDTLGSHHISFYEFLMLNMMYDCLDICKVQRSPRQERVKRQMGYYFLGSSNGRGPSSSRSPFSSSLSRSNSIYSGTSGNSGSSSLGALSGSNNGGLRGEAGSRGSSSSTRGTLRGSHSGLPGEQGVSNGGGAPAIMGGRGQLPGDGGDTRQPGEKGISSSSTGGWKDWWRLPGKIGEMLPDWIWNFGANWEWDYTVLPPTPTTTTSRPVTTTTRPTTTTRTTTTPTTTTGPTTTSTTTTTTTTTAPVAPGPSRPEGPGPTYETAKCTNGGFPNPRDCSKCVCPRGYGGRLCNERPAGAGKILQAKTKYQTLIDTIGYPRIESLYDSKVDFLWAHYWIQAPKGRKIEIKVGNYSVEHTGRDVNEDGGCPYVGVEIKTQRDQRATGYRYCFSSWAGQVFVSESNLVPIITYSRTFRATAKLRYRMI